MTGPVSPTGPPTTAGHSVLVVPIPALETLVAARHAHYDRDYVSADPTFAHAHVTTLGPWLTQADLADRWAGGAHRSRDIASAKGPDTTSRTWTRSRTDHPFPS
jgi:hypothetical protein